MKNFSDESKLLAKNWQTYQDILNAEKQLRTELSEFLRSLESELIKNPWWNDGWNFVAYEDAEIYIAHPNWVSEYDEYVVAIGVEGFTAERLFGMEPAALLYVKASDYELGEKLTETFKAEPIECGEIDYSSSRYLVTQPIKVMSNEVEKFDKVVRQPILEFLSYYANMLWQQNEAIENSLN